MAKLKTSPNDGDVHAFLDTIEDEQKRKEAYMILELMQEITGAEPQMWGSRIVGFGSYHYKYKSGREGDWFEVGFSPRKRNFSLYLMAGFGQLKELLDQLGKYKTGKSCLYINRLSDVDSQVLRQLIQASVDHIRNR